METYLSLIEKSKRFDQLVEPGGDSDKWYKRYARICHPDAVPDHYKKRAEEGFKKLQELYNACTKRPVPSQVIIAGCVVTDPLAKGDISDLYCGESATDPKIILKIIRRPADNDLMDREKAALQDLWKPNFNFENFKKYLPKFYGGVKASGRRVNILHNEQGYYSLQEISTWMNANVDFRHIVWMMNRALSVLGFAHRNGYVHGAVLPSHLLYHPTEHGLKLIDWCYSCTKDQKIPAIVRDYIGHYPPEVAKKMHPGPWTDIYMLMKTMTKVTGKVPKRFEDLIQWCMAGSPASRPNDAWNIQDRWVNLAREEYGPPKYFKLDLPSN